jgi:predicted nuclease with TOPRIM domain
MIRALVSRWLWLPSFTDSLKCAYERIKLLEERNRLAWERIVALEQLHGDLVKKQNELNAIVLEVRQLREMLNDPKNKVIVAKTTHQFRALMEHDF